MSTGPSSDRETSVREKLVGYPDGTVDAVLEFLRDGGEGPLHRAISGILHYHTPARPDGTRPEPSALSDETRLREDLGIDSLAFAEMGFLVEDLLGAQLPEEDLLALQTVADFRAYVRSALRSG